MKHPFTLPLGNMPLLTADYSARPNRFLVSCEHETHGTLRAFLPNPGRLSELFFPGVKLHVLDHGHAAENRATRYTVLAVEREGRPVMLHTHWCNNMAESLLKHQAVPGLEDTCILRREVKVGRSRFDFLLEDGQGEIYLEIKSCTLFGNGVAMFPDAVTERGRRHLLELAELAEQGRRCRVLVYCSDGSSPVLHAGLSYGPGFRPYHACRSRPGPVHGAARGVDIHAVL